MEALEVATNGTQGIGLLQEQTEGAENEFSGLCFLCGLL